MRFKSFCALTVLLIVGSNDARPSKNESPEVAVEEASTTIGMDDDSSQRPIEQRSSSAVESDSRLDPPSPGRKLKDLQYMDQSMRTVATQLLNVSNTEESTDAQADRKIANGELAPNVLLIRKKVSSATPQPSVNQQNFNLNPKNDMELIKEINSDTSSMESMGMGFGRPVNSKFGYFESSHPGQAMAMTEEELERELMTSTTKLITAQKNYPTTTGGISTWILLNPPTTTSKPAKQDSSDVNDDKEVNVEVRLKTKSTTPEQISETTAKTDVQTSAQKTFPKSTTPMERITTLTKVTVPIVKKTTLTVRQPSTAKPEKSTQAFANTENAKTAQTTSMSQTTTRDSATTPRSVSGTKKLVTASRPAQKLKATTSGSADVTTRPMTTKLPRPGQSTQPKPSPTRRVTTKPVAEGTKTSNTPKIEKVTFRPVQMITTPKSQVESVERPIFATKLKASFVADQTSKTSQDRSTETTPKSDEETKTNEETSDSDLVQVSVNAKPQISTVTKPNNALNVQSKKSGESPKVKNQSVKVNEPVSRIEKIEETNSVSQKQSTKTVDSAILDNSRIDLKFDFDPELTRIDVSTSTTASPRPSATKRLHKRKKNKVRRRKPTTSAPSSIATSMATSAVISPETSADATASRISTSTLSTSTEIEENLTESSLADNSIQESKIAPESKVSPGKTKNTKNKQQLQKPIGTQIYNFLSREGLPSFGMMSLVGLGLGLASYLLYPFGGVAARRNYVAEPNYKYNLDEYGGNYGQNEEEVFSKVLQGMTNSDGKYGGIKDYENNYYRYQQFDGAYTDSGITTRKGDQRHPTSSSINYRPPGHTTVYDKFRRTEFKYPDLTTTPNYYERNKQTSFSVKKPVNGNSRFVVGNVPKEYGFEDKNNDPSTVTGQTNFERDIVKNDFDEFGKNPVNISPSYGQEDESPKTSVDYEEIVITPAAVAVEHGPRSLRGDSTRSREKRESVIQVIPSRTEIMEEMKEIEKEDPLSNEILDIIGSVIPAAVFEKDADTMGSNKVEDKKLNETEKVSVEDPGIVLAERMGDVSRTNDKAAKATTQTAASTTPKTNVVITSTSTSRTAAPISSTTAAAPISSTTTAAPISSTTTAASTSSTTTVKSLSIDEILATTVGSINKDPADSTVEWFDTTTTAKPKEEHFGIFNFVKKIAEVKFKLGLALLKHASEGFAKYLGHVQKRVNGEE